MKRGGGEGGTREVATSSLCGDGERARPRKSTVRSVAVNTTYRRGGSTRRYDGGKGEGTAQKLVLRKRSKEKAETERQRRKTRHDRDGSQFRRLAPSGTTLSVLSISLSLLRSSQLHEFQFRSHRESSTRAFELEQRKRNQPVFV